MTPDRLIAELEKVRDTLYREQPMTMDAMNQLLDVLEYHFCPHEWETKLRGGDSSAVDSMDVVTACKLCGAEKLEE